MKFDIVAFMENAARCRNSVKHTDTEKHFFRISGLQAMDEVLQSMGEARFPAILVEDELDGQFIDNNSDNVLDMRNFIFYVEKQVRSVDMDDREDIIRECNVICRHILSLMFRYKSEEGKKNLNDSGLRYLDRSSVSYFTIGPVGDNCFGIACGFQILDTPDVRFDESAWTFPS